MSAARNTLLARLHAFGLALDSDHLVSRAPTELDHNARAALLRNGLAVVGFAALEDFIKTRSGEILARIGSGSASFSQLPARVRMAATSGVVDAMRFQVQYASDSLVFLQEHARHIASTAGTAFSLSPIAFGHSKSNLSSAEVAAILESFQVDSPWNALGAISRRIGVGVVALKSAFDGAAERRHRAAHDPAAAIEISDLQSYVLEVLALAVGFDLLLSAALRHLLDADADYIGGDQITAKKVKLRFIKQVGSGPREWAELAEGAKRAVKRGADVEDLIRAAFPRARANGEAIVVVDRKSLPTRWMTPATD